MSCWRGGGERNAADQKKFYYIEEQILIRVVYI